MSDPHARPQHAARPAHGQDRRRRYRHRSARPHFDAIAEQGQVDLCRDIPPWRASRCRGHSRAPSAVHGAGAVGDHDDVGRDSPHDVFDVGDRIGRSGGSRSGSSSVSDLEARAEDLFPDLIVVFGGCEVRRLPGFSAASTISLRSASEIRLVTLLWLQTGSRMTTGSANVARGRGILGKRDRLLQARLSDVKEEIAGNAARCSHRCLLRQGHAP